MSQILTRARKALPLLAGAALLAGTPMVLAAQGGGQHQGHQMDHAKMHGAKPAETHGEGHAASGWKELDAYHGFMMATWHPAKDKNDLTALRAQAAGMVTSAKALAASTAPAHCAKPALKAAAEKLVGETQAVADLVTAKKDDATLKAALKALHDSFEVLEEGCQAPGAKKH